MPSEFSEFLLEECQEAIGYHFIEEGHLRTALIHSSAKPEYDVSNERLEFLGDSVLGLAVTELLYKSFPHSDEGPMTKIKSVVVSAHTLCEVGISLGIDRFIVFGKGLAGKKKLPRSVYANILEAIIGAIYIDAGFEEAAGFVLRHVAPKLSELLEHGREQNYKSLLQQWTQKHLSTTPTYEVLGEDGPDHAKRYEVAALVAGTLYESCFGSTKKEAEQKAANKALVVLAGSKFEDFIQL
ncbi:MAG: ribonuclease III [Planctomycetes bacterium]|nr:ribonuclease III [Planctomycetota bacterium]